MSNIIAICGAQGSGKTTLSTWLKGRGYKVVSEEDVLSNPSLLSGKVVIDGISSESLAEEVRAKRGVVFFLRHKGVMEKKVISRPGDCFIQNSSLSLLFDTTAALLRLAA